MVQVLVNCAQQALQTVSKDIAGKVVVDLPHFLVRGSVYLFQVGGVGVTALGDGTLALRFNLDLPLALGVSVVLLRHLNYDLLSERLLH